MNADSRDTHPTPLQACLRLAAVLLAVVLLAAACGGDDAPAAEDAQPEAAAVALGEGGQESSTDASEPDAGAEPEPQMPVRLGNRFAWCATIQQAWSWLSGRWMEAHRAELRYYKAQSVFEAATDELDKAEALRDYELAEEEYDSARLGLVHAAKEAMAPLAPRAPEGSSYADEETARIAISRARDAFAEVASPELVALIEVTSMSAPMIDAPATRLSTPHPVLPGEPVSPEMDARMWEELRAAIDLIHAEMTRLKHESDAAKAAAVDAYHAIQAAQQLGEAWGAYERLQAELVAVSDIFAAADMEYATAHALQRVFMESGGEFRPYERYLELENLGESIPRFDPLDFVSFHHDSWVEAEYIRRIGHEALWEATSKFIPEEPAWRAFQLSLAESCEL